MTKRYAGLVKDLYKLTKNEAEGLNQDGKMHVYSGKILIMTKYQGDSYEDVNLSGSVPDWPNHKWTWRPKWFEWIIPEAEYKLRLLVAEDECKK